MSSRAIKQRVLALLADGDLAVRVPARARNGELQALEAGFNAMAEAIAESQRTLQARVDEATVQLAWQARHDPLTGLANRRAFEERIEQAVRAHRRSGDQITLGSIGHNLGKAEALRGDYLQALREFDRSIATFERFALRQ